MKATRQVTATVGVLAALLAVGCSKSGPTGLVDDTREPGLTRIYLTDAPFPYDTVLGVEVYITSISASTSTDTAGGASFQDWVDVAQPRRRFDLLTVQRGTTVLVGEGEMPAGLYRAVRMVVNTDSSVMTYLDGAEAPVQWQVAGEITLNALVEAPLDVPEAGADIVIDFDVGRSFPWMQDRFLFIPWFRAVNEAATGGIQGTVSWERGPGYEPIAGAGVTVYRGDATMPPNTWSVAATGQTDSAGHYEIHYLLAGRYIMTADPPFSLALASDTAYDAVVSARELSMVDFVLPPWSGSPVLIISGTNIVAVGDSALLHATVFDADGDTVPNPPVSWMSGDTAVAVVAGSGADVAVAGRAPGTAAIVATSGSLVDTLDLTVVTDTTGGGDTAAAVASVAIVPSSLQLPAGDSTTLLAIPQDSAGTPITGRTVTWFASDTGTVEVYGLPGAAQGNEGDLAFVRGLAAGATTVTAVVGGQAGSVTVVVTQTGDGSRLVLSGPPAIAVGDSAALYAAVFDANGDSVVNPTVTWTSGEPGVASVSGSGQHASAFGLAQGTAPIIATSGTLADTLFLNVYADTTSTVDWVTITPASVQLAVGDSALVLATPRDSAGNALAGHVVTWSVADSGIVTVVALPGAAQGNERDQALIFGLAAGTATIRAVVAGIAGTATVTVTQPGSIRTHGSPTGRR